MTHPTGPRKGDKMRVLTTAATILLLPALLLAKTPAHHRVLPLVSTLDAFDVSAKGPAEVTAGTIYSLTVTITRDGMLSKALAAVGIDLPTPTEEQQDKIDSAKVGAIAGVVASQNGLDPKAANVAAQTGMGIYQAVGNAMEGGVRKQRKTTSKNTNPAVKYGLRVAFSDANPPGLALQNVKTTPFMSIQARFPAKTSAAGTTTLTWLNLPIKQDTPKDSTFKMTMRFRTSKVRRRDKPPTHPPTHPFRKRGRKHPSIHPPTHRTPPPTLPWRLTSRPSSTTALGIWPWRAPPRVPR